jgi:hypothetical protein
MSNVALAVIQLLMAYLVFDPKICSCLSQWSSIKTTKESVMPISVNSMEDIEWAYVKT